MSEAFDLHWSQGQKLYDDGKFAEAVTEWQEAMRLEPNFEGSFAYRSLANTQMRMRKKQEAIATLKAAIVANPNDAEAYLQLREYQSLAMDFKGMVETIHAIDKLPASDVRDRYYADVHCFWARVKITVFIGAGLAAVLIGGWIWSRRRDKGSPD